MTRRRRDLDRRLLDAAVRRFPVRRRQARFVAAHLDEIRERAAGAARGSSRLPARVWVYWGQGFATLRPSFDAAKRAHALPHRRRRRRARRSPRRGLRHDPDIVRRRTAQNRAKFSDYLRLELLFRYGGVWLDATCLVRGRLPDVVPELLGSGFFAFQHRPARIASWFLASEPNHPVVVMTREAQHLYWERFAQATDYFALHHLVESLYYVADEFRERSDLIPLA